MSCCCYSFTGNLCVYCHVTLCQSEHDNWVTSVPGGARWGASPCFVAGWLDTVLCTTQNIVFIFLKCSCNTVESCVDCVKRSMNGGAGHWTYVGYVLTDVCVTEQVLGVHWRMCVSPNRCRVCTEGCVCHRKGVGCALKDVCVTEQALSAHWRMCV